MAAPDGGGPRTGLSPAKHFEIGGIPVACRDQGGEGLAVLCVHESTAASAIWDPLAKEIAPWGRAIAYDRRGWGESGAPEGYRGTTIAEHAEDAAELLTALGLEEAIVCGAGFGAVVALDLMMRSDSPVSAAVLIEPPLFSLLPEMTEGLVEDRQLVAEAVREGGPSAAARLYTEGKLPHLGPGAGRIPPDIATTDGPRAINLFAELAAAAEWELRGMEMISLSTPSRVVVGASTPPLLRRAAADLEARLGGSNLLRLGGEGLPHLTETRGLANGIHGLA